MNTILSIKKVIIKILFFLDIKLIRTRKKRRGKNLNIGCGDYKIKGFINLDFNSEFYYNKKKFDAIHYDMRSDNLPFDDESIDNIYCSHVIEHIETKFVEKFFYESNRVLKKNSILRIACPDSYFLYLQMMNNGSYYNWHHYYSTASDCEKCFVDEVATHRCNIENFGLKENLKKIKYEVLMEEFRKDGVFDKNEPGRHINNWDFNRLSKLSEKVGFSKITLSKFWGSSSPEMQAKDMDLTHPEMSLYAEFKK